MNTHPNTPSLIDHARRQIAAEGWTIYPDVHGFAFVAVARADIGRPLTSRYHRAGQHTNLVVGVAAALQPNIKVLSQAVARSRERCRPDYVIVLTSSSGNNTFETICRELHLIHWTLNLPSSQESLIQRILRYDDFPLRGTPLNLDGIEPTVCLG